MEVAKQVIMENFEKQLNDINIAPKSTSWMKLENRLYSYNVKPVSKLKFKMLWGTVAASLLALVVAGFFLLKTNENLLAPLSQDFVIIDSGLEQNEKIAIYDIKQLTDLGLAYKHHALKMN